MKTLTRKQYWEWFAYAILSYAAGLWVSMVENDILILLALPLLLGPVVAMIIAIIRRVRVIGYWWALLILVPFGWLIIGAVPDPVAES